MGNLAELSLRKKIALAAARQAGKLLLDRFGHINKIKSKGDRDMVTDIDLAAESIIKNQIIKNFPCDSIISEENSRQRISDYKWIVDPMDGTHNYIHNINIFGTSIALAYKDEVVLGVIYMPRDEELYWAQKKKGAYLNSKPISVSARNIKQATLIFDSSLRYQKVRMLKGMSNLVDKVFNLRMFGSTVRGLSYVAEGKAELEVEYNDKVWDFAAGLLLVEEAGGRVTDLKGNKWGINSKGYIASNGKIHREILLLLK
ncbi:MAG: inositol monophosphatase [Candidatus Omnitrophica bacterium]|nr:inositol monophosphatase [Candidatus Omnitrophota bacterium]